MYLQKEWVGNPENDIPCERILQFRINLLKLLIINSKVWSIIACESHWGHETDDSEDSLTPLGR